MAEPLKGMTTEVSELWQLVVAYFKQEAIEPIKDLGRFIGWGVSGSLLLGTGLVMLTLAGLRALQTETGSTFTGSLSWVPYLVVLVGCGIVAAFAVKAISEKEQS